MIVVDASVVIDLLLGAGSPAGDSLAESLRAGDVICAPHLVDAEVGQVLRRFALHGNLSETQAESLLEDFLDLPIKRYPHSELLARAFGLRSNVTVYDGLYLALAEALDCRLLTGDNTLRKVPGYHAVVEVLATSS